MRRIFALLLLTTSFFATTYEPSGLIMAKNSTGWTVTSFLTSESVHASAMNLMCRSHANPSVKVTYSNNIVYFFIVPHRSWPMDGTHVDLSSIAVPQAYASVYADGSGNVPLTRVAGGNVVPAGNYDLVMTHYGNVYWSANHSAAGMECTDLIFPVVGGTPPTITVSAPPQCTGTLAMTLSPATITAGDTTLLTLSGLSNCGSNYVDIRRDSCAGTVYVHKTYGVLAAGDQLFPSNDVGTHTFFACVDENGNGVYDAGEKSASAQVTIQPPCSGNLALSFLTPNPTTPSSVVQVTHSGLTNCGGRVLKVFDGQTCPDPTTNARACTYVVGGVNACSFNSPAQSGTFSYIACVDIDQDGTYNGPGEQSVVSLSVQAGLQCDAQNCGLCNTQPTCAGATCFWWADNTCHSTQQASCGASNLNLCTNPSACSGAGGNWCNNACQATACGAPGCSSADLTACATQTSCQAAGGNWCAGTSGFYACQYSSCQSQGECSSITLPSCRTQGTCIDAGGHWCNNSCQSQPCPACSAQQCGLCATPGTCSDASCYWYADACHSQQQPCSGNISFTVDGADVAPKTRIEGKVSGLSNCDGRTVLVVEEFGTRNQAANCTLKAGSCSFNFTVLTELGNYSYAALVDRDENGLFTPAEKVAITITVRAPAKIAGLPEWLFFLAISIAIAGLASAASFFLFKKAKPKLQTANKKAK